MGTIKELGVILLALVATWAVYELFIMVCHLTIALGRLLGTV